jgi:pyoverdine/dityrosine biosynthesis protein Dit1
MRRQREAGDVFDGLQLLKGRDVRYGKLRFDLHIPSSPTNRRQQGH